MDFWRRAARVSRDKTKEIMRIKHKILDDITLKQLRWYGHMKKTQEHRLPKNVFE